MHVISALPAQLECGLYHPNGKAEADITYFCRHFSEAHFLLVKDKKELQDEGDVEVVAAVAAEAGE